MQCLGVYNKSSLDCGSCFIVVLNKPNNTYIYIYVLQNSLWSNLVVIKVSWNSFRMDGFKCSVCCESFNMPKCPRCTRMQSHSPQPRKYGHGQNDTKIIKRTKPRQSDTQIYFELLSYVCALRY